MREPLPSDVEPSASAPDAHVEAVRNEHRSELAEALAALPAQQREAVLLRDVRGFSYEEVAASLAVSTSAVESLLFRARSRLRSQLRTAYAAISGAGWIGPLRELLGTGGLAGAPVAAKAVAVGALGVAVAGGVVAPTVLEHRGPASPPPTRSTAQQHAAQPTQRASAPPVVFSPATPRRPTIEDVSAVSSRSTAGREGEHGVGGGDGAESQSSGGSSSERQDGGSSGAGRNEGSGSGSESRTHGEGESGSGTGGSSPSSEQPGRTETGAAPVAPPPARPESADGSGDSSASPPSGSPSAQPDPSGSTEGGDGSDG